MMKVSPAQAIGSYFWSQFRGSLLAVSLLSLLSAICLRPYAGHFDFGRDPQVMFLAGPGLFGIIFLQALSTFPATNFETAAARSGFAAHLLRLPVGSRDLALWPMLYAALVTYVSWMLFASVAFAGLPDRSILWWPAVFLVASCWMAQACAWQPARSRYLFVVCSVVAKLGPLAWIAYLWGHRAALQPSLAICLGVGALCFPLAIRGVRQIRMGEGSEPYFVVREKGTAPALQPFRSPIEAEQWLCTSANGWMVPLATAGFLLFNGVMMFVIERSFRFWIPVGIGTIQTAWGANLPQTNLSMPLMFASMMGQSSPRWLTFAKERMLPQLTIVRPVSGLTIVAARLRHAAWSSLITAVMIVGLLGLWLQIPARNGLPLYGSHEQATGTIGSLILLHYLTPQWCWLSLVLFACAVLLIWNSHVTNLWAQFYGTRVAIFCGAISLAPLIAVCIFVPTMHVLHPVWERELIQWFPLIGIAMLLAKALLAIGAMGALYQRKLARPRLLWSAAGIWLAVVTVLFCLLDALLPAHWISPVSLALTVALLVPIGRIALAPLALAANRHR